MSVKSLVLYMTLARCLQLDITLCLRLGVCVCLTLYAYINKSFVWAVHRSHLTTSCLSTVSLLLELLFAILGYFSVPCLSRAEVAYAIDFICIC